MANNSNIYEHLSHQQWLLSNGFINDMHKDNLFLYGSIVHKDVQAVDLAIDSTTKTVSYTLYCTPRLLRLVATYGKLIGNSGICALWRLRRLIRKEGNLNFKYILNRFVRDYCGKEWQATLSLKDIKEYDEEVSNKTQVGGTNLSSDKPADDG